MNEAAVAFWLVVIGSLTMLPFAGTLRRWGYAAMIIPAGYAVYLLAGLVLTSLRVFSTFSALVLATVAAALPAVWTTRPGRIRSMPWGHVLSAAAFVSLAAVAVAVVADALHLTRLTPDSMNYLTMAGALERKGTVGGIDQSIILKRQLAAPLLHSPGVWSGAGYTTAITALLGLGGAALLAWLAARGLASVNAPQRWRWWLVGGAVALLLTTNRVVFNLFYVHTHMIFAVLLLLGVGLAWLAVVERRPALLFPAALGFAALVTVRAEAAIVAIVFLLPIVVDEDLPRWGRLGLAGSFAATTVLWYGITVSPHVGGADRALTGPVWANVVGAVGVIVVAVLASLERTRRLARWVPLGAMIAAGGYVGASALRSVRPLEESVSSLAANLAVMGRWGAFWYVAVVAVVAGLIAVRIPGQRMLVYPLVTYPLLILAFVYLRDGPYRIGAGDSGNRMMMHITFVILLYAVVAAGLAAARNATEAEPVMEERDPALSPAG